MYRCGLFAFQGGGVGGRRWKNWSVKDIFLPLINKTDNIFQLDLKLIEHHFSFALESRARLYIACKAGTLLTLCLPQNAKRIEARNAGPISDFVHDQNTAKQF